MKNNKGFSLVELIIVIAIMAILAGALAPALIKYINKSRKSTDVSNAQTVATALTTALATEAGFDKKPSVGTYDLDSLAARSDAFGSELKDALKNKVPQRKYNGGGKFYVQIEDANGNFKILDASGGKELYPNVDSSYK